MNNTSTQILLLYDNKSLKKGLTSDWGFSCLIILPQYRILFDTGGNPSILLENMREMGVDHEKIDSVILSHWHGDHVGGLSGFLQCQHSLTVYIPKSFPNSFKNETCLTGADVEEIGRDTVIIHPGVHSTGQLGWNIKEQSLILQTAKGLVIITGCAHPGILKIVDHVRKLFKEDIYLLIGGFHLMHNSSSEIMGIAENLKALKVEMIAPCHCSGDDARELFSSHYGENYIECGAGLSLNLPALKV